MIFEVGQLKDGRIMLVTDKHFPGEVRRAEFYRDMKLFMLVYDNAEYDSELMDYEISEAAADVIKTASSNIYVVNAENPNDLVGFDVPLVQVGV